MKLPMQTEMGDENMYKNLGLGQPVASLQTMLRELGKVYNFMPPIAIDGIFGESTMESLLLFQREVFPPVTGVVTKEVWEAIRSEVLKYREILDKPRVLRAFPEGNVYYQKGDVSGDIMLYQQMFQLLGNYLSGLVQEPPSGEFTENLRKNVIWLQNISNLPETGSLDRQTWGRLVRLYEIYITSV